MWGGVERWGKTKKKKNKRKKGENSGERERERGRVQMVLLEKLWDDVLAGPQPDRGLGKLRKLTTKPLTDKTEKGEKVGEESKKKRKRKGGKKKGEFGKEKRKMMSANWLERKKERTK